MQIQLSKAAHAVRRPSREKSTAEDHDYDDPRCEAEPRRGRSRTRRPLTGESDRMLEPDSDAYYGDENLRRRGNSLPRGKRRGVDRNSNARSMGMRSKGRTNDMKAKRRNIQVLSLGTSSDYKECIKAGSNLIRVGEILFGPRL